MDGRKSAFLCTGLRARTWGPVVTARLDTPPRRLPGGSRTRGEDVVRFDAVSAFRSVSPGVKISIGAGRASLQPMMWMFIAILATFLITRTVTRLIRSGSGAGAGLGNVRLAGVHVHHQVFGILIIIGTGIVLVSATPHGAALDVAAAIFGVGVSLTLDEFALWLHLQDVYWTTEGRKSVDAIFCVLAVTGALIGGATFLSGRIGTTTWWSSVSVLAVNLMLSVICLSRARSQPALSASSSASSPSSAP